MWQEMHNRTLLVQPPGSTQLNSFVVVLHLWSLLLKVFFFFKALFFESGLPVSAKPPRSDHSWRTTPNCVATETCRQNHVPWRHKHCEPPKRAVIHNVKKSNNNSITTFIIVDDNPPRSTKNHVEINDFAICSLKNKNSTVRSNEISIETQNFALQPLTPKWHYAKRYTDLCPLSDMPTWRIIGRFANFVVLGVKESVLHLLVSVCPPLHPSRCSRSSSSSTTTHHSPEYFRFTISRTWFI